MSDSPLDTIKSLLGDNAEEKIKTALSSISGDSEDSVLPSNDSIESVMQIKNIIDNISAPGNDARSNLLMSLRPYMRSSRQSSIDTAIRMLNITKLSGVLKMR